MFNGKCSLPFKIIDRVVPEVAVDGRIARVEAEGMAEKDEAEEARWTGRSRQRGTRNWRWNYLGQETPESILANTRIFLSRPPVTIYLPTLHA